MHLEGVSVEYRAPRERIGSLKEYAIRLMQGRVKHEEFRALDDVSFDVLQGEVFGVIGHNGAGKSTLLKVASRVIRPTRGRVRVRGRIAPLLELGAGFHGELSGRENVFLNGTLLGYTRAEIEAMFDEIVDFAELWDFIEAPLRTYSTGMGVRLGFAVATARRPDVLLVDEVLSVGDERFQEKCAARIAEFRQSGATVLLVTHDTRLVLSMCDRAVWLDHGRAGCVGAVAEVVEAYHDAGRGPLSEKRSRGFSSEKQSRERPPSPTSAEVSHLEEIALGKSWFYSFDLPSGRRTECLMPDDVLPVHDTRWRMLAEAIEPLRANGQFKLNCLDLGCGQGFFSVKLAQAGCQEVVGVDARAVHVQDADLLRRIYGLSNLQFRHADIMQLSPKSLGQFDIVLLLGMMYQFEDPIGALRIAKSLTRRMLIVETQLAPDLEGDVNWGAATSFKRMEGSFAVLDRSDETGSPFTSLTPISLIPGRRALLWLMERLGFSRIEILPPPPDAYEQLASGQRVMVVGHV